MATPSSILVQNPMDRGAWRATVHGVAESAERLSKYSTASLLGASQVALAVKNLPANAGDTRDAGSIPGSPVEGHGNPHQYFCLENYVDREAVHRVTKSRTRLKGLSLMHSQAFLRLPGWLSGKEPACQCRDAEMQLQSLG